MDFLDDLSIRSQLFLVAAVLLVLFFLVRFNTKRNRNKRLKNRNFGEKLKEKRKADK